MKKNLLFLLFQLAALALFSQESINFLGGEVVSADGSLSFSTAEIGISHLEKTGSGWLTEGFQQPEIAIVDTTIVLPTNFLPHGFTPGDDGLNDFFDPILYYEKQDTSLHINRAETAFTIINRWGEIVFHADSYPDGGWNGHAKNGHPLPMATYYFLLNLHYRDNKNELVKGPVTIVRRD